MDQYSNIFVIFFSSCSDNSCPDQSKEDNSPIGSSSTPTSSKLLQLYQRRNQQIRTNDINRASIAKDFSAEILREIYGSPKPDNRQQVEVERFDSEAQVATMQIPRASSGNIIEISGTHRSGTLLNRQHEINLVYNRLIII